LQKNPEKPREFRAFSIVDLQWIVKSNVIVSKKAFSRQQGGLVQEAASEKASTIASLPPVGWRGLGVTESKGDHLVCLSYEFIEVIHPGDGART
jgi:hypothetical protein